MNQPGPHQRQAGRIKGDLILVLVAILWGTAFAAQRVAAQYTSVNLFNGTRFLVGALFLLPFWLSSRSRVRLSTKDTWGILLAGCLVFAATSLQQAGLRWTSAANAGFITGLYVVLIPLFMAIILRKPPKGMVWIAASLATVGLFLLSTGGTLQLAAGDGYELVGAVMFAMHVILIGWLVKRVDILTISVIQYGVCATLCVASGLALNDLSTVGLKQAWWAILYTGIFSVGLGYSLQAVGQKTAPPAEAAIILSGEAMVAALSGWLWLGEKLDAIQILGCALMLTGMILAQVLPGLSTQKNLRSGKDSQ